MLLLLAASGALAAVEDEAYVPLPQTPEYLRAERGGAAPVAAHLPAITDFADFASQYSRLPPPLPQADQSVVS